MGGGGRAKKVRKAAGEGPPRTGAQGEGSGDTYFQVAGPRPQSGKVGSRPRCLGVLSSGQETEF